MINFDNAKKEFNKYVNKFNIEYGKINLKIRHTYGVVKCSEYIANDLNLSNEDVELSKLIALLHDIGRFEQIRIYDDFRDYLNVDHAELGCKLLFDDGLIRKFIAENKYDDIIFKSIINHNKLSIEPNLNERELLHSKIIRDADKTDNFRVKSEDDFENIIEGSNREILENGIITEKIYNDFMNNKLIISNERKTYMDCWISYLAFIFDYNFDSGLKYINDNNYINKIIDRLDYKNPDTKDKVEKIRIHALNFLNSRL